MGSSLGSPAASLGASLQPQQQSWPGSTASGATLGMSCCSDMLSAINTAELPPDS